jgi:transposase
MELKEIVGIDVAKKSLDVCIKPKGTAFRISNDRAGFAQLMKEIQLVGNVMVVMEHTGHYSLQLEKFLSNVGVPFCKLPALEIKRSMGMVRGKNDKVDAARIAEYGWLRKHLLSADSMIDDNLMELRNLLSLRSKLVKDRSGYLTRLKEFKAAGICTHGNVLIKVQKGMIKSFTAQIIKVESSIKTLMHSDVNISQSVELLKSIKGVGLIVAVNMVAATENFRRFKNARKFNCYAGLAPFNHESGSSIKGRARVSHMANKEIKTLLNLAAFSAIRYNAELKRYYQTRVAEGKAKMCCVNIIRAKLVARMFAIVKRQTPYQELSAAA